MRIEVFFTCPETGESFSELFYVSSEETIYDVAFAYGKIVFGDKFFYMEFPEVWCGQCD